MLTETSARTVGARICPLCEATCDTVRIASNIGAIVAELRITGEMRTGVVSLPHGWGHHGRDLRTEVVQS